MANAPRPGVAKRKAAQQQARKILRITVDGTTVQLAPDSIPFSEQIVVRKSCGGLPLSAFWGDGPSIGVDSLQVLFWLGRRACGEPGLTLATVLEEWPDTLNPDAFDVVVVEPDETDDDPES